MLNINNSKTTLLVTIASGFLGAHCVKQLLNCGNSVVGTVRSLQNKLKVQSLLNLVAPIPKENFKLIEADLNNKECWKSAIFGCSFVLHVDSPFPIEKAPGK